MKGKVKNMNNEIITNCMDEIVEKYRGIQELHEKIEKKKEEVNSDYSVRTYTKSARQQELDDFVAECKTKENSINQQISKSIKKIRNAVCGGFEPNVELAQQIDFLATMARGGMISSNMISATAEKFKGSETNLLYLKQKLKEVGIKVTPIDEMLFSTTEIDVNGDSHFIPPTTYFDELAEKAGNGELSGTMLIAHLQNISDKTATSEKLTELQRERNEQLADAPTSVLI